MSRTRHNLNITFAAFVAIVAFSLPSVAQESGDLNTLFTKLKDANPSEAHRIGEEIQLELSKTGSPAMDLLLKRGRDSMASSDFGQAIEHFTALTDHSPEFAEGWHARSVAYANAGLYGPALADLEQALSIRPRHFVAIYSLAALLEEVGQPELAYDAYSQVRAIHPYFEDVVTAMDRLDAEIGGSDL